MSGRARYALTKIVSSAALLVGVSFVCFGVVHLAPGSAVDAKAQFNPKMTSQAREKLEALYGLDKPFIARYASWAKDAARLRFGRSFADGEEVAAKIGRAVAVTLTLNLLTLAAIFALGVPLGVWSALRAGSRRERALGLAAMVAYSTPAFWLALLAMSFFGVGLRVLPVSGLHSIGYEEMSAPARWVDAARHLVLPVSVAALTGFAGVWRYMKSGMMETLGRPYVRTARAKGLSEAGVVYRHALPNALLPVITLLGLSVPALLGGSVLFESVFSIPGMGRLFYLSVMARDYPVIMGILLLGAVLTLAGNLLADLAYAAVDPRIRLE